MKPKREDWPVLAQNVDKCGIVSFDEIVDLVSHGTHVELQYVRGSFTRSIYVYVDGGEWNVSLKER